MKRLLLQLSPLALAATVTGCAGFEQNLTIAAPSGQNGSSTSLGAIAPSLVGTWGSAGSSGSGNSCTNFQWRVTGQTSNSMSGDFSADCVGGLAIAGSISGQLTGTEVPYQASGTATVAGGIACPFALSGTARIEGDTIRIPYSGSTCLGPLRGEEVVRKRSNPAPDPPAPAPPPPPTPDPVPPPPPTNAYHVGPGPLTAARAEELVNATAEEFAGLTAPRGTEAESLGAAQELLRRVIWHLQLAGYQAGRQRNPSGAISGDKLTVFFDGKWQAYDIFRDVGVAHRSIDVIFFPVTPPNHVPDGGIPD